MGYDKKPLDLGCELGITKSNGFLNYYKNLIISQLPNPVVDREEFVLDFELQRGLRVYNTFERACSHALLD